jgi:hypothetical protein
MGIITHKESADILCSVELGMNPIGVGDRHELGELVEELSPLLIQSSRRLEAGSIRGTGHGVTTTELRNKDLGRLLDGLSAGKA